MSGLGRVIVKYNLGICHNYLINIYKQHKLIVLEKNKISFVLFTPVFDSTCTFEAQNYATKKKTWTIFHKVTILI